ncbi:SfnB family sulfur acquisition oxidoreductase [Betaproteobacteria bacterium]|nr:SfnB family sulfur acquisition oxidoreductase [Betaproteobacteria bacterium]GHT98966.1 SfnB family sulfur acquisition oxidoreductase [Betaproteobacteria bacterium]GHU13105.1 SfnB family sulfur acquisition oxidoreductase [Betaproteobacteria bacterium]GHU22711.1 SfnB family sulfur acquisition oxidoreductase [Betaproteobacteria bacterium]
MSTQQGTQPGRQYDPAPTPGTPAHIIRDDAEAIVAAQQFAAYIEQDAQERDEKRILPWKELDVFSQSGLWGVTIPKEYGGAGVSNHTLAQAVVTIAAADGNFGHIPQNHFYALEVLRVGASEEQKKFFFDRILKGERFGNALAETGHKDFKRRTILTREKDGWFVHGKKFYATGALYAHWIPTLVTAQEEQGENRHLVIIPRTAPGVTIIDDWDGFGQRVTGSGSVIFDRVRVEPEWVVPFQSSFERPTTIGPVAQILHAALDLGIGHGAFKATLPFVREHGRAWIDSGVSQATDDPLLLDRLGDVYVRLRAADLLLERSAGFVDRAQARPTEDTVAAASVAVAEAKVASTEASLLAATRLFELGGTRSTLQEFGLDRYWRNVRTHTLHDPVRWKYRFIGDYVLNGKRPPRNGTI